jgi:hypothetical protein
MTPVARYTMLVRNGIVLVKQRLIQNPSGVTDMAKKTVRTSKRPAAAKEVRLVKGVRLDLSPGDHGRLERVARERGLTMSSYARMRLLECIKADEAEG